MNPKSVHHAGVSTHAHIKSIDTSTPEKTRFLWKAWPLGRLKAGQKKRPFADYAHDLHYRTAMAILAGEGVEGPEAEELAAYAARLNCARYDGERAAVAFDPDFSARWLEVAPETARRYGYDIDPTTLPDQTRAVIEL